MTGAARWRRLCEVLILIALAPPVCFVAIMAGVALAELIDR